MDFQLSDEQQQLKKSVREFAEREIAPNVMKWDEASEFPLCTVKQLGKLGLLGTVFPNEQEFNLADAYYEVSGYILALRQVLDLHLYNPGPDLGIDDPIGRLVSKLTGK